MQLRLNLGFRLILILSPRSKLILFNPSILISPFNISPVIHNSLQNPSDIAVS